MLLLIVTSIFSGKKIGNIAASSAGSVEELWQAFFANPVEWWDNRKNKVLTCWSRRFMYLLLLKLFIKMYLLLLIVMAYKFYQQGGLDIWFMDVYVLTPLDVIRRIIPML